LTRRAFAPGHVSGLFAVHDEASDPLAKGSRGAGWSLDAGATATVRPGRGAITVDGQPRDLPVTAAAVRALAPAASLDVELRLDLPVGQGFGMSAAGTLAACLAAVAELDLEPEHALAAAHAAEVTAGTGLGDVVGSWNGAGELRLKPGVPPHGWAMRVDPAPGARFLFCVMGEGIPTPRIIKDAAWKLKTRALGDPAVDRILAAGRARAWEVLLDEAHAFSLALGLMPVAMRALGDMLPPETRWGQSMLGNTLWCTGGGLDEAERLLAPHGMVVAAGVDPNGARLVR
jgi:pantoate kinase